MINRLSVLVDRQKQAPASAATFIQARVPPPALALASGSGSGSEAVSLEAWSASNFHVGHRRGRERAAAATARRNGGLSVRVVAFDTKSPALSGVDAVEARREKKKVKDPNLSCFGFVERKGFRNREVRILILNSDTKKWRIR